MAEYLSKGLIFIFEIFQGTLYIFRNINKKAPKKQTKRGSVKLTKYNYANVLSFDLVTKSGLNLPLRLHIIKPKHTFKNN